MTPFDLPPKLEIPKPAIFRLAEHSLLRPGAFRPVSRAERRTIIADLVQAKRLTLTEAKHALFFVPVGGRQPGRRFLWLVLMPMARHRTQPHTISRRFLLAMMSLEATLDILLSLPEQRGAGLLLRLLRAPSVSKRQASSVMARLQRKYLMDHHQTAIV
jgi:hypothetical protein